MGVRSLEQDMELSKLSLDSRDWTDDDLDIDERFTAVKKEWVIVVIMYAIHVLFLTLDLYVVGNVDPTQFTYVLGLPLHIFLLVVEFIVLIAVIFFIIDKVFVDMEMTPIGKIIPRGQKE